MRTGARNGALVGAASIRAGDELMLISATGQMIRMPVNQIRVIGRATKGVRLINLDSGDMLVSLAKVAEDEQLEEKGEEKSQTNSKQQISKSKQKA